MSELTNRDVNIPRLDSAIMLIGKYSAYDEQEFREDMYFLIRQSVKVEKLEAERDALCQLLATERDAFGKRETELMAERDALNKTIEERGYAFQEAINKTLIERNRYRECLLSISKNTCCDKCQEAALWAKSALGETK